MKFTKVFLTVLFLADPIRSGCIALANKCDSTFNQTYSVFFASNEGISGSYIEIDNKKFEWNAPVQIQSDQELIKLKNALKKATIYIPPGTTLRSGTYNILGSRFHELETRNKALNKNGQTIKDIHFQVTISPATLEFDVSLETTTTQACR